MKTFKKLVLTMTLIIGAVLAPHAAEAATLVVDHNKVSDNVMIENGTSMLPLRELADALKAPIDWENGQAKAVINGQYLVFTPGELTYTVNGEARELLAAPRIKNDRIFIPIRAFSQEIGQVDWVGEYNTVVVVIQDIEEPSASISGNNAEEVSADIIKHFKDSYLKNGSLSAFYKVETTDFTLLEESLKKEIKSFTFASKEAGAYKVFVNPKEQTVKIDLTGGRVEVKDAVSHLRNVARVVNTMNVTPEEKNSMITQYLVSNPLFFSLTDDTKVIISNLATYVWAC